MAQIADVSLVCRNKTKELVPIGSMYAIDGNIYHQYTPNVSIYTSTMDPSWGMAKSQHHRPSLALLAWRNHPQVSGEILLKRSRLNILTKQKGTCREKKNISRWTLQVPIKMP